MAFRDASRRENQNTHTISGARLKAEWPDGVVFCVVLILLRTTIALPARQQAVWAVFLRRLAVLVLTEAS